MQPESQHTPPASVSGSRPPAGPGQPRDEASTWLLMGHKAGDNSQVLALAEALGEPFQIKRMVYRPWELATNLLLGPNLAGIDKNRSSALAPPWPSLIITAGRRNEPVARWIRAQAGGDVKLVHIGRPWAALDRFDLIITTPQYCLPAAENVLHNHLPLHRVEPSRLEGELGHWQERLEPLPRPRIAVLVGGDSGPFCFDTEKARLLGRLSSELAQSLGGSLLVTTSSRTAGNSAQALIENIFAPAHIYQWSAGPEENPYFAYLALADCFVVTGESMSMLAEASATRKPVYIFDLSEEGDSAGQVSRLQRWRNRLRYKAATHWLAQRLAPMRMRRDIGRLHDSLIRDRRAVWLGDTFPETSPPELADTDRAVTRTRELFTKPR